MAAVNDVLIGRLLAAPFASTLPLFLSVMAAAATCSNSCTIDTLRVMHHWTLHSVGRGSGHWPVVSANDSPR